MSANNESSWSPDEVVEIANRQKFLIWLILAQMGDLALCFMAGFWKGTGLLPPAAYSAILLLGMIAWVVLLALGFYGIYRMAYSLRKKAEAFVYVLAMLFPFIGLLMLASIVGKANQVMQENGVRVGVMGANPEDLQRLRSEVGLAA